MNNTQNVQTAQGATLQQPQSNLQPMAPLSIGPQLNQEQLSAATLRVGDATIQPTGTNQSVVTSSFGVTPLFILGGLVLVLVLGWLFLRRTTASASQEPLIQPPIPEHEAPLQPVKKQKAKKSSKNRPAKKRKSKKAA